MHSNSLARCSAVLKKLDTFTNNSFLSGEKKLAQFLRSFCSIFKKSSFSLFQIARGTPTEDYLKFSSSVFDSLTEVIPWLAFSEYARDKK